MKWLRIVLAFLTLGGLQAPLRAQETGTVTSERVNVRAKPSILSEVITQLNTADRVTILERIRKSKTLPGEPVEWLRIRIPSKTAVWIFGDYIDPETKTVTASRLNVRAGPDEKYTVLGRLDRGAPIKKIRSSAGWISIEPPPGTFAYIAASFVKPAPEASRGPDTQTQAAKATVAATGAPEKPSEVPDVILQGPAKKTAVGPEDQSSKGPASETEATSPSQVLAAIEKDETSPAPPAPPTPAPPPETQPAVGPAPATPDFPDSLFNPEGVEPVAAAIPIEKPSKVQDNGGQGPSLTAPTKRNDSDALDRLRRMVTREGIVKRSVSIQAPTYHRLEDARTGKTINYLYTGKLELDLGSGHGAFKPYEGRRIRVMGEEAIDKRWPRIPVIEVEKLRLLE